MEHVIGLGLALLVCGAALVVGMDRDRAFYPTMLIVVASYYVLFATLDDGQSVVGIEVAIAGCFTVAAVLGFQRSLWIVVVALGAHGAMDLVHGAVVHNAGVPAQWPGFCATFDLAAAAFLGWRMTIGRRLHMGGETRR